MARERIAAPGRSRPQENPVNSRIFWNEDEKQKIAAESYRILSKDKRLTNIEAIDQAQKKVLQADRRRPLDSINFSKFRPWIVPMWDAIGASKTKQEGAKASAESLFDTPPATDTPAPAAVSTPENTSSTSVPGKQKEFDIAKRDDRRDMPKEFDIATTDPRSKPVLPTESDTSASRQLVRWTDAEKMTLARSVYKRMEQGGIERLDALREAMAMELDADRQRVINTWMQVQDWIEPMMRSAKAEAIQAKYDAERRAVEEARRAEEEHAALLAEQERLRVLAEQQELEVQRRVAAHVDSMSFEALIRQFAKRMAVDMLTALRDEIKGGMIDHILDAATAPAPTSGIVVEPDVSTASNTPVDTPVSTPAPKLPKIMVIGLYPVQEQDVQKAFLGVYDFIFVPNTKLGGQGAGGNAMVAKQHNAEVIIGMSDHMGMDVLQKRKHLSKPFVSISGAVSNLKRWLSAYHEGNIELPKVGE